MVTRAAGAATYTQAGRPITVTVKDTDSFLLTAIDGDESLSQPFHYTLDLLSTDPSLDPGKLLRCETRVQVTLADGTVRTISGHLSRVAVLGREHDTVRWRAELVPKIWFLGLTRDQRVFAEKNVQEVVQAVLEEAGLHSGSDFSFSLNGSYPKARYFIQYRESSLDFMHRLLEDAGIWYFFEHGDDGTKVVFADGNSVSEYGPGMKPVRMAPAGGGAVLGEDVLTEVQREDVARPGKYVVADYNYRNPSLHLLTQEQGPTPEPNVVPEELYDFPARFRAMSEGRAVARTRLEEQEAQIMTIRGWGACRMMHAGSRFDLADHHRDELNATYLCLRASLSVRLGGFVAGEREGYTFSTQFTAMPFGVTYRPPRVTPLPRIPGVQTAVVGPAEGGEEIMVDENGRVPVQFHWDRRNKDEGKPSVWARVSSLWAGAAWGGIAIPRIGQEVIVDFLEGDPDRPVVTGRLYNGEQVPPYALPAHQTRTTIKTRSSPNGGPDNFNEIRFEDKKGSEHIYIHAEKDKVVIVENNRTENVGNDETIEIGNNRRETVHNTETISIGASRTKTVGTAESVSIGADQSINVGSNQTVNVGSMQSVTVGAAQAITVGAARAVTVGANEAVVVGNNQSVTVAKNQSIQVGAKRTTEIAKEDELRVGKKLTVVVEEEIEFKTGDASITMKKDGTIKIKGKDIQIEASGKINAKASGDVILKGSKVTAN